VGVEPNRPVYKTAQISEKENVFVGIVVVHGVKELFYLDLDIEFFSDLPYKTRLWALPFLDLPPPGTPISRPDDPLPASG
jgi:hypothetical protein